MARDASTQISVALIDPDEATFEGVRRALELDQRFRFTWRGATADMRLIQDLPPEVIIVDPTRDSGIDLALLGELRRIAPSACIAVYTLVAEPDAAISALRAGVSIYLLKGRERRLRFLCNALALVAPNQGWAIMLDARIAARLPMPLAEVLGQRTAQVVTRPLTKRQLQVLRLSVQEGESDKLIADLLDIAASTVETHMRNISENIGATSRTQLGGLAVELGLVETARPKPPDSGQPDSPPS